MTFVPVSTWSVQVWQCRLSVQVSIISQYSPCPGWQEKDWDSLESALLMIMSGLLSFSIHLRPCRNHNLDGPQFGTQFWYQGLEGPKGPQGPSDIYSQQEVSNIVYYWKVSHHFILKVGINVGTIAGGGTDLLHQQEPLLTGLGIYPLEFNAGHSLDPLVSLHYDSHLRGGVPHLRVNEESNVLQGISTT